MAGTGSSPASAVVSSTLSGRTGYRRYRELRAPLLNTEAGDSGRTLKTEGPTSSALEGSPRQFQKTPSVACGAAVPGFAASRHRGLSITRNIWCRFGDRAGGQNWASRGHDHPGNWKLTAGVGRAVLGPADRQISRHPGWVGHHGCSVLISRRSSMPPRADGISLPPPRVTD